MRRAKLAAALAVALVAGLIVGSTAAAIAVTPQQYTGCLTKEGTLLRVAIGTTPAQSCRPNETQINWNSQGPKGDPGSGGGASVVTYPWPGSWYLTAYCGTAWFAIGALGTDCQAYPVVIPDPLTGIDALSVLPIDASQYPAGAKISLRYQITSAAPGTTACVRLFDAVALQAIAGSQICSGARGWHTTPPVPVGSLTLLALQVQQPDATYCTECPYWPEAPVQYGTAFVEVTW